MSVGDDASALCLCMCADAVQGVSRCLSRVCILEVLTHHASRCNAQAHQVDLVVELKATVQLCRCMSEISGKLSSCFDERGSQMICFQFSPGGSLSRADGLGKPVAHTWNSSFSCYKTMH